MALVENQELSMETAAAAAAAAVVVVATFGVNKPIYHDFNLIFK